MRTLALIVFACAVKAASGHSLCAQVTANVEAGVSDVQYDGFLASAAFSLSPTMRWEHRRGRGFISARGTYLRFESGRHSLDASANGSWFTPLRKSQHWRGELGLAAGASNYANIASFNHGQLEARIHVMAADHGGWAGVTVGRTTFGSTARSVSVAAVGLWWLHGDKTLFVSIDRSFVGETAYSDLRSSGRWRRSGLTLEGVLGARVWSRGGGRGVFGEGSATVPLSSQTALLFSAGRYPTDAISGSIAGRYATVALRLGSIGIRKRPAVVLPATVHSSGSDGLVRSDETRLEIQSEDDDDVRLTVYAPGATTVEVSGDFTDWRPVLLSRNPRNDDAWVAAFRISRGMHRINVRRDGGSWMAPGGTMRRTDDYDGEVGVFVLP